MVLKSLKTSKEHQTLYDLCGLDAGSDTYKLCHPSQILKTEELV